MCILTRHSWHQESREIAKEMLRNKSPEQLQFEDATHCYILMLHCNNPILIELGLLDASVVDQHLRRLVTTMLCKTLNLNPTLVTRRFPQ